MCSIVSNSFVFKWLAKAVFKKHGLAWPGHDVLASVQKENFSGFFQRLAQRRRFLWDYMGNTSIVLY